MFKSARIKLTLWYLMIIMLISLAFSAAIYEVLTLELGRFSRRNTSRIESRLQDCIQSNSQPCFVPPPLIATLENIELVEETKNRIITSLIEINLAILIFAGGLGYVLAGKTLLPIQEMVLEQGRFITDASHELKTPLTSLKTALEVHLRNKKRTQKEADLLVKDSITDVNKLQRLSESLLELASFQAVNGNSHHQSLSLTEVVNEAVKTVSAFARKKHISLSVQKSEDIQLHGASEKLTQLLVILLDNAIKYSPHRTKIEVSLSKKADTAKVSITDHGQGIAQEHLPHIFKRFYRGNQSRTESGSYGLGLAIAQQIVKSHHGSIAVNSQVDKGTTFVVCLPIKKAS
ncbi:MAG: hypothetical protein COY81_05340 [Candidatus Pacebacteria bacterium CG_4_10_14_0_8_um_filter_43_12]|nr:MAG: hypothetical protein COU66_03515 [Candidatus Pacebacteria bacterium CG10_big_fil_rev_8_21_14_0_10_44_11]PIY78903.1 MAG: hypothetical protein COY81_05340 [Candidatus Pacebacteria bacterium CG_4_10_14_0_8_um_filter_43_12]